MVGEGLDIDSQVVSKNYKKQETEFPVLRFILESSELDGQYPWSWSKVFQNTKEKKKCLLCSVNNKGETDGQTVRKQRIRERFRAHLWGEDRDGRTRLRYIAAWKRKQTNLPDNN